MGLTARPIQTSALLFFNQSFFVFLLYHLPHLCTSAQVLFISGAHLKQYHLTKVPSKT